MKIITYMRKYLYKYKLCLILFIIITIILSSILLILPMIYAKLINVIIYPSVINKKMYVYKFSMIILSLYIVRIIFSFISSMLQTYLRNVLSFELNRKLIKKVQRLPMIKAINTDATYLTHKINSDCYVLADFFLISYINIIISVVSLFAILAIIFTLNVKIFFILISMLPLYIFTYVIFRSKLFKSNRELKEIQNRFFSKLMEQLTNIKFLKTKSLFEYLDVKLMVSFKKLTENLMKYSKISFVFSSAGNVISQVMDVILILLGGLDVINGVLSIGSFSILSNYFDKVIGSLSSIMNFFSNYQNALVSLNRLRDIEALEEEMVGTNIISNISEIQVNDLNFRYNDDKNIFENFNYNFKSGQIYLIVGNNGAGKSSLMGIILSLIQNYDGEVMYNKKNILTLDMYKIRTENISVVEQDPVILSDTIFNNIVLNSTDYDVEKINYYIEKFNLKCFNKETKLKTYIDSTKLSGGEKQKIALIRALIKKCDLMILDEPSSSLDCTSVSYLKELLCEIKFDKIILLISHDSVFRSIADECIYIPSNSGYNDSEIAATNNI